MNAPSVSLPEVQAKKLGFLQFSTADAGAAQRRKRWARMMEPLVSLSPLRGATNGPPAGTISAFNTGLGIACLWTADAGRLYRSPGQVLTDHLDHIVIIVRMRGLIRVAASRPFRIELRAWDVGVLDLASPILAHVDAGELLALVLPRLLLPAAAAVGLAEGRIFRREGTAGELLGRNLAVMAHLAPRLTAAQGAQLTRHIADILSDALQSSEGVTAPDGRPRVPRPAQITAPALMGKICRYIESNLMMPELGPSRLAKEFGVSRSQLYRMFEPMGGVLTYIRDLRLRRALTYLQDPQRANERVSDIAFELGFLDMAHFSRLFRKTYGMSPRTLRRVGPAMAPVKPMATEQAVPEGSETDIQNEAHMALARWLRELRAT